jgi:hypothetical protein
VQEIVSGGIEYFVFENSDQAIYRYISFRGTHSFEEEWTKKYQERGTRTRIIFNSDR